MPEFWIKKCTFRLFNNWFPALKHWLKEQNILGIDEDEIKKAKKKRAEYLENNRNDDNNNNSDNTEDNNGKAENDNEETTPSEEEKKWLEASNLTDKFY